MSKNKLLFVLFLALLLINIGLGWFFTEEKNGEEDLSHNFGQSVRGAMDTTVAQVDSNFLNQGNSFATQANTTFESAAENQGNTSISGIITIPSTSVVQPAENKQEQNAVEVGNTSAQNATILKEEIIKTETLQGNNGVNITSPPAETPLMMDKEKSEENKKIAESDKNISTVSEKEAASTIAKEIAKDMVADAIKENVEETTKEKDRKVESEKKQENSKIGSITGTITAQSVKVDGNKIIFRLEANAPLKGRTTYLTNPDRVLLDIDGKWNVKQPVMPENTYAKALRMGFQEDGVRFVFDTTTADFQRQLIQISPQVIELTITFP